MLSIPDDEELAYVCPIIATQDPDIIMPFVEETLREVAFAIAMASKGDPARARHFTDQVAGYLEDEVHKRIPIK